MPQATNIVEFCDAITAALRARGFFAAETAEEERGRIVDAALADAGSQLGLALTPSEAKPGSTRTVLAEGIPGVVTIVTQRRIGQPDATAEESINPDFGVTWQLA